MIAAIIFAVDASSREYRSCVGISQLRGCHDDGDAQHQHDNGDLPYLHSLGFCAGLAFAIRFSTSSNTASSSLARKMFSLRRQRPPPECVIEKPVRAPLGALDLAVLLRAVIGVRVV